MAAAQFKNKISNCLVMLTKEASFLYTQIEILPSSE